MGTRRIAEPDALSCTANAPSAPVVTWMALNLCRSARPPRILREISGSSVLVRMLSTLRAPLSTSVQRRATSSTSGSS